MSGDSMKFKEVFKRVLITGKQCTGKTTLARDICHNHIEINDVNELPKNSEFVAVLTSDKPISLNGVVNLHLASDERIEQLEAALREAHKVILHELDSGRTPYLLPVDNGGKGLGYFEDVLAGLDAN